MTAWSYSSLTAFETCPRRWQLTKLTKQVKEPQTEATLHGNAVHKALELHTSGQQWLPEKYKQYLPIAEKIKLAPGTKLYEHKFALNSNLRTTEYFAKDVWLRGVFDVVTVRPKTITVLDYKTGKKKFDADQLKLFAAAAFQLFPFATKVNTAYVWLRENELAQETFTQEDVPPIWGDFSARAKRIDVAVQSNEFPPRPSGLCREWCPVGQSLCEHCGKQ